MTEPRDGTGDASIGLRDIGPSDLDWLHALNSASVPHVNLLEPGELAILLERSDYARCVLEGQRPVGALIGFWPGADYGSVHYRWFQERYSGFLYIDRVMIEGSSRSGGHGRRLYADFEHVARAGGARSLACEVNSRPPNPVSMRFHERLGFRPIGELSSQDRSKSVVLMMKSLDRASD